MDQDHGIKTAASGRLAGSPNYNLIYIIHNQYITSLFTQRESILNPMESTLTPVESRHLSGALESKFSPLD